MPATTNRARLAGLGGFASVVRLRWGVGTAAAAVILGSCGPSARAPAAAAPAPTVAVTPPMGWNSWDAYSRTIHEDDIRKTAQAMAQRFAAYGWQYVVIDEGWYLADLDPSGNVDKARFSLDPYGRFVPEPSRFPSAAGGAGFKPLADYIHSLGLKFGIHILRGIPRQAVQLDLPIAGSSLRAAEAANPADACPWNSYNYGLDPTKPGAQDYYDSIARLYASWGVDFIKADCISSHPYAGEEIRMLSRAIASAGRPMVLSLSPGPTPPDRRAEVVELAQMWRISNDVWDVWSTTTDFPQGVKNQVATAARWVGVAGPGHWPDADMLPLGDLKPAAGWDPPRHTRLTLDEQRTVVTFWSIIRSPLMMGGNLLSADAWTVSLLTNPEVIAVDQHSIDNRPVVEEPDLAIWVARSESRAGFYLAVVNLSDAAQTVHARWQDMGLPPELAIRDLWERRDLGVATSLEVVLPPHASALYGAK